MNRFDYVKVLLYAYPKLDALAEAAGGGAQVKAYLSFRSPRDALGLSERIAEEIVMSKKLFLLREELDKVISTCSERELYLLEYKYFRRREVLRGKFSRFSLDVSERTYFRMQNALLSSVFARLTAAGLTRERFLRDFSSYRPFMRVLAAVCGGKERAIVFKRRKKLLALCQNSGNSCGAAGERLPRKTKNAITINAAAAAQITAICVPESPCCGSGVVSPPSPAPLSSPEEA